MPLDVEKLVIQVMYRTGRPLNEVLQILSCFGYEIDHEFVPVISSIDGFKETGMTPEQFNNAYADLLEDKYEKVSVVSVSRNANP